MNTGWFFRKSLFNTDEMDLLNVKKWLLKKSESIDELPVKLKSSLRKPLSFFYRPHEFTETQFEQYEPLSGDVSADQKWNSGTEGSRHSIHGRLVKNLKMATIQTYMETKGTPGGCPQTLQGRVRRGVSQNHMWACDSSAQNELLFVQNFNFYPKIRQKLNDHGKSFQF